MRKLVMKYNPAFMTPEQLVSSFVVRQADLELLVDVIRDNTKASSNQHILVTGARGMGKTTLVLRVAAEVRAQPELNDHWYPLVFAEEAREVGSLGEFWLESLFHLADQTQDKRWQTVYDELKTERDEIRLRERAMARLMDFADEQGKRILLIVENLQMLLDGQISNEEAWDLRHPLQNEPRVMLLGTATSHFEQIKGADKAMHDLFKYHDLKPLDDDECRVFWNALTGDELEKSRVRPIRILTGGNPRLLAIIAAFAENTAFGELMTNLTRLIDDHTDYLKSHLDSLPPQECKVYVTLADLWDPSTAREVAEASRLQVNQVSSNLSRLVQRGAVTITEAARSKQRYQVTERLFNIYHLMRRRGGSSGRVEAVVRFMVSFYDDNELVRICKGLGEEAISLAPGQRGDHYCAFTSILTKVPRQRFRKTILQSTPREFLECPEVRKSLGSMLGLRADMQSAKADQKPMAEKLQVDLTDPVAVTRAIDDEWDDAARLTALADSLLKAMIVDAETERAFRRVIALSESAWAWFGLGVLLDIRKDYDEAEQAYRKSTELAPDIAGGWLSLGQLLSKHLGRESEAEQAYRKALEIDPVDSLAWTGLGVLLHIKLEKYNEAEEAYRKVVEINQNNARVWFLLGELLYHKLGKYSEAEQAYRKAIEIDPVDSLAWPQLIDLILNQQNRFEEVLQIACDAIEKSNRSPFMLTFLALMVYRTEWLERMIYAESWAREALEKAPEEAEIAYTLASILADKGDWEEAFSYTDLFLSDVELIKEGMSYTTNFFIAAAANGQAKAALNAIVGSPSAALLEPLVCGLRMFLGEPVNVAQEIREIAEDVMKRIQEQQQKQRD